MSALEHKTFILGVGAQKAGTSWLRNYLNGRSEVWMAKGIKELNVLNVLFQQSPYRTSKAFERLRDAIIECGDDLVYSGRLADLIDRVRAQFQPYGYRQFFESRVGTERLFGDITPAYARLPPEAFSFVKQEFPRSKAVFLLRDPVERHFSALRMREQRTGGRFDAIANFLGSLDNPGIRNWGYYHVTYKNLRAGFAEHEIFVGFYETFFSDSEIGRLCNFLEIPFIAGDYGDIVNPSSPKRPVSREQWVAAREVFADVYTFCQEQFGSAVPSSWN